MTKRPNYFLLTPLACALFLPDRVSVKSAPLYQRLLKDQRAIDKHYGSIYGQAAYKVLSLVRSLPSIIYTR